VGPFTLLRRLEPLLLASSTRVVAAVSLLHRLAALDAPADFLTRWHYGTGPRLCDDWPAFFASLTPPCCSSFLNRQEVRRVWQGLTCRLLDGLIRMATALPLPLPLTGASWRRPRSRWRCSGACRQAVSRRASQTQVMALWLLLLPALTGPLRAIACVTASCEHRTHKLTLRDACQHISATHSLVRT
jgi:hypothetical protein